MGNKKFFSCSEPHLLVSGSADFTGRHGLLPGWKLQTWGKDELDDFIQPSWIHARAGLLLPVNNMQPQNHIALRIGSLLEDKAEFLCTACNKPT